MKIITFNGDNLRKKILITPITKCTYIGKKQYQVWVIQVDPKKHQTQLQNKKQKILDVFGCVFVTIDEIRSNFEFIFQNRTTYIKINNNLIFFISVIYLLIYY